MQTQQMQQTLRELLLGGDVFERFTATYRESRAFRAWLDGILPEVSVCYATPQRTPWHIYPVMEHILRSVEKINNLSAGLPEEERALLSYTMFFHDMGKPACRTVRIVEGEERDSFKLHNFESEKIARRALPLLGFSEEAAKVCCELVKEHDIFLKLSEEPAPWQMAPDAAFEAHCKRELAPFGDPDRLYRDLLLIGLADNLAQNPALTQDSIAMIEKLRTMSEVEAQKRTVEVVAALLVRGEKFLICRRPENKPRALLWEFVGGKVEAGESKQEALVRECREELGITVRVGEVFCEAEHTYPDIRIRLTLFSCTTEDEPKLLEHSDMRWISPAEIPDYSFCPADGEILRRLQKMT